MFKVFSKVIYEFIFYFTKVEDFLTSKGIEFSNKGQSTFDIDVIEKNGANTTPMSAKNNRYDNSQNEGKDNMEYDNNTTGDDNNQKNSPADQRDVEISSGFDQSGVNNPNVGQNAFGF